MNLPPGQTNSLERRYTLQAELAEQLTSQTLAPVGEILGKKLSWITLVQFSQISSSLLWPAMVTLPVKWSLQRSAWLEDRTDLSRFL